MLGKFTPVGPGRLQGRQRRGGGRAWSPSARWSACSGAPGATGEPARRRRVRRHERNCKTEKETRTRSPTAALPQKRGNAWTDRQGGQVGASSSAEPPALASASAACARPFITAACSAVMPDRSTVVRSAPAPPRPVVCELPPPHRAQDRELARAGRAHRCRSAPGRTPGGRWPQRP